MNQVHIHTESTELTRFKHGQVTLPASISEEFSLEDEDLLEVSRQGNTIVLTPKEVVDRHPEIDAAIAEGLEDIRQGRVTPVFNSMEEFEEWNKNNPE